MNNDQDRARNFIDRIAGRPVSTRADGVLGALTGAHPRREDEQLPQRADTTRLVDKAGTAKGPQQGGKQPYKG